METMSNVQGAGNQLATDLGGEMMGEAIEIVNDAIQALVRLGRRQPLVAVGVGVAAAIAYAVLKPATRKSVRAAANNLFGSLVQIGGGAGYAPAAKRRTARGSAGRAKRTGRGQRSAARNGRQAHA